DAQREELEPPCRGGPYDRVLAVPAHVLAQSFFHPDRPSAQVRVRELQKELKAVRADKVRACCFINEQACFGREQKMLMKGFALFGPKAVCTGRAWEKWHECTYGIGQLYRCVKWTVQWWDPSRMAPFRNLPGELEGS
ncbi:hypothetical protein DUNSADRAFT_7716, partial [Dunaliella salina]